MGKDEEFYGIHEAVLSDPFVDLKKKPKPYRGTQQ